MSKLEICNNTQTLQTILEYHWDGGWQMLQQWLLEEWGVEAEKMVQAVTF
jgi:hypothetical protein